MNIKLLIIIAIIIFITIVALLIKLDRMNDVMCEEEKQKFECIRQRYEMSKVDYALKRITAKQFLQDVERYKHELDVLEEMYE